MTAEKLYVKREGDFRYPIYFEKDFLNLATAMKEEELNGKKVCIITDTHVGPLYVEKVKQELEKISPKVCIFTLKAGEKNKNLQNIEAIYEFLITQEFDRKSLLVALGGGVVGDMTGFAAATYLRGIDFVQVPTTLLAQVDSSVGGKTGVDFQNYKNMVGAFHQPRLVYMNMQTLSSLPEDEFACGMGEVLKTGLISDGDFYHFVCESQKQIHDFNFSMLAKMIRRCCEIKAGIVERDPKEQGERALLNLGHTIGHAVEKFMNFQMLHGQCVAVGLVAAAAISKNRGLLSEEEFSQIKQGCQNFHLPVTAKEISAEDIIRATKKDKKMEHGQIKFILMNGIGNSFIDKTVTDTELLEGISVITA